MHLFEFREHDKHIPGTVVGLHPASRFEDLTDAKAVTEHWPDDGTHSVEPVEFQGKVMFYVIAIRDEDDGDIVGLL